MKRTLLITEFYPPTVGGSVTVYDNIYRLYPPDTVWVLTQRASSIPRAQNQNGIRVHRTWFPLYYQSKLRMLAGYLWCFLRAAGLIRKNRIEEVHCDQVLPAGVLGWMIRRLLKVPYYVYAHGEEISIGERFPFRRKWMKRFFEGSSGVFANSRFTASLVRNLGVSESKIEVIYWGVHPRYLQHQADPAALRKKYGVEGKKVLLTISRLIRRKGHAYVLKALRALPQNFFDWHYLVVGAGEEGDYLALLAKDFGLENRVSFLGRKSEEELLELYSVCDLFVMPNIVLENGEVEGFGLVFLEAGALRKPVIGGNSGGTSDAIIDHETGLIVHPHRPGELLEAMQLILSNLALARRFGEAARRRIEESFVWEKVLERLLQFQRRQGRG